MLQASVNKTEITPHPKKPRVPLAQLLGSGRRGGGAGCRCPVWGGGLSPLLGQGGHGEKRGQPGPRHWGREMGTQGRLAAPQEGLVTPCTPPARALCEPPRDITPGLGVIQGWIFGCPPPKPPQCLWLLQPPHRHRGARRTPRHGRAGEQSHVGATEAMAALQPLAQRRRATGAG